MRSIDGDFVMPDGTSLAFKNKNDAESTGFGMFSTLFSSISVAVAQRNIGKSRVCREYASIIKSLSKKMR